MMTMMTMMMMHELGEMMMTMMMMDSLSCCMFDADGVVVCVVVVVMLRSVIPLLLFRTALRAVESWKDSSSRVALNLFFFSFSFSFFQIFFKKQIICSDESGGKNWYFCSYFLFS